MKEKFNEKVIPVILKFINTKGIQSIKNGMVTSMSPLIIGSIFLILSNFPDKGSCRCIRVYRNQSSIRSGMWCNILHQCDDRSYRYQL